MTQDLLISIDDMPPGWSIMYGPEKVGDNSRSDDSAHIGFYPNVFPQERSATQEIYRYTTVEGARRDYSEAILFPENTNLDGWTFSSKIADESKISCYTYSNSDIPVCNWYARYEEFVVEFYAWIGSDRLSFQEMENLVEIIDNKMTMYLGKDK